MLDLESSLDILFVLYCELNKHRNNLKLLEVPDQFLIEPKGTSTKNYHLKD